jgi:hypothetical protein
MVVGYEGAITNYCMYLLVILNSFKPQKSRILQKSSKWINDVPAEVDPKLSNGGFLCNNWEAQGRCLLPVYE